MKGFYFHLLFLQTIQFSFCLFLNHLAFSHFYFLNQVFLILLSAPFSLIPLSTLFSLYFYNLPVQVHYLPIPHSPFVEMSYCISLSFPCLFFSLLIFILNSCLPWSAKLFIFFKFLFPLFHSGPLISCRLAFLILHS